VMRIRLLVLLLLGAPLWAASPRNEALEEAIESYLRTLHEGRVDLGTMLAVANRGTLGEAFAPADPTQFARALSFTLEWVKFAGDEGDVALLHTTWSQPLGQNEEFRLLLDLPIGYADTSTVGDGFGLGDVRIQFAWRPWDAPDPKDAKFLAWTLQVDLLMPTGRETRALGGGDWLVAPAAVFKFQFSRTLLYLTTRWIYADAVLPAGVRGFNIPGNIHGSDSGPNTRTKTRVNELNLELTAAWEFDRRKNAIHWTTLTIDYGQNFAGNENSMVIGKARIGRRVSETLYVDLDLWFPLFGERTFDLTFRFAVYWEF